MKILYSILLLVCLGTSSKAQYNNVWTFGGEAGLDFNTSSARAITCGIGAVEACASICNSRGELLFYTDGFYVRDRKDNIMPNGNNLPRFDSGKNHTYSTSQGALAIPVPGDTNRFYIFSMGQIDASLASPYFGKLYYSIVDMRLNNGMGDVEPGIKGILLDTFLTEQMGAVSGPDCSAWLIVASRTGHFKAYSINHAGIIKPPVLSERVANIYKLADHAGYMDISRNGTKLVMATGGNLSIYQLDIETGKVSHFIAIEGFGNYYGAAFSPDETKLYASGVNGIEQFDLSNWDSIAIAKSRFVVSTQPDTRWGMRLGPDGKIYISNILKSYLSVIHKPDQKGAACTFEQLGLKLKENTGSNIGLPNHPVIITRRKVTKVLYDTIFCIQQKRLSARDVSGEHYLWDDSSTGSRRLVRQTGIYWVQYRVTTPCLTEYRTDTFKVYFDSSLRYVYTTMQDTGLCTTDILTLRASRSEANSYTWEDGSGGYERKVNRSGNYRLEYQIDSACRYYVDSFRIHYPKADPRVSFEADTLVCIGQTLNFNNTSAQAFNRFEWRERDSLMTKERHWSLTYRKTGNYPIRLTGSIGGKCFDTMDKMIHVDPVQEPSFRLERDSLCQGEMIVVHQEMDLLTLSDIHWDLGDGNRLSAIAPELQHAYNKAGKMRLRMEVDFRACPSSSYQQELFVESAPIVDLGADTSLCGGTQGILLRNRMKRSSGENYQWSTGDTGTTLNVYAQGHYQLEVRSAHLECLGTGTIHIGKDCHIDIPNAFSPNGDGYNDYFFPRQLLSSGEVRFHMEIFNRWGILLFATDDLDGRGWDGYYNGQLQPAGIYIYNISAQLQDRPEVYKGNVTLLR